MTMHFEPFSFTLEQFTSFVENEFRILSMDKISALDSLRKELQMVESYLMDVDEIERRASVSHVLSTQLQHLREIALDVEDLLDMFYEEAENRMQGSMWKRLKAFFSSSNPLVRTHQLIERVEKLKQQLKETINRPKGYQLPSNLQRANCRHRPRTYPYTTNDEFVIGLEEDGRSLVTKLARKEGDLTTTLAIVGMGGSGKTTLARKVYNHKDVLERFPSRAWVCVSQEWSTAQLLREICVQVGVRLQSGGETSIPFHMLREFLTKRSCLIVLDDVWSMEALQELLPLLLSTRSISSGRVLITTRNRKVVNFPFLGGLHIHKTRFLTLDESWELFSTLIRKNWQGLCEFEDKSNFAQLGKKMLEKCTGLPLAIVTLVGLLCTKGTVQEWECVNRDVMSRIMKHETGSHDYGAMKEILELSYVDLPYYLKSCFLYLGIYGEDEHIHVEQLTQLWIAEGFVKSNLCDESETLEELARDFLDELVQRSMVQVYGKDYEGKFQTIRIHDVMRDFCIKKAEDLSFFEVSSSSISDSNSSMKPMSHRAIIHKGKSFPMYNPRLRSLICSEHLGGGITKLELPYEKMKLLRVLHLVKVDVGDSAEAIENLPLLRYLRIERCCGIKKLVRSTVTLKNLLTFIYIGSHGQSFPNMVGSMEQLRHLSLSYDDTSDGQTLGVDKSRNLQVLRAVAGEWLAKELCVVTFGLQELHLTTIHSQTQLEAVSHLVCNPNSHLHTLRLSLKEDSRLEFHLEKLKLERSRLLKRLVLWGKIGKQRTPLWLPPNLLSLELRATRIEEEEDLKHALAQLDQLRHLILDSEAYNASRLTMIGLPQLQELTLSNMSHLEEWIVEKVALPQLKMLHILNCYKLERIPKGITYMSNLQCLRAHFVSKSFCERLRQPFRKDDDNGDSGEGGEDFHLIEHIPFVEIRNIFKFSSKKTCSI